MAAKETKRIFVIETGQTYDSLAAAARAVGVDPSNARKALKGLRASAGGYHFSEVERIEQTKQQIVAAEKTKVKRQNIDMTKRALVDVVHNMLVDVNKRARNARKEGLFGVDEVLQRMMSHTDFYGSNKTGGYITNKTHLRQFSSDELRTMIDIISAEKQGYYENVYSNRSKNRNLASYALQFGLSNKEMEKYWHLLPAIFELFRVSKQKGELQYKESGVVDEILDAMQGDADPEDLLAYVKDLTNFYNGNTKSDLDSILEKHSETRSSWLDEWEEIDI